MGTIKFTDLPIKGLQRLEPTIFSDERGEFRRIFCSDEITSSTYPFLIRQINRSFTKRKGCVRGMHFQRQPYAEKKIIFCLAGSVWDVAVDVRENSPTFLQWHAEVLSKDNGVGVFIPEGFAHGFQAMTDEVELLYFHSNKYSPAHEDGLNPLDPLLGIEWPLDIQLISSKDKSRALIEQGFTGGIL